ncbi:hypothetical protein Vretifemale_15760 [Volvox reticuliferus]|uniref:Uncharacterized protein n=1 Tax=Volvox reticuliferus TaxID=1737510 RepID=A0A8J4FVI3_9CHLO|nr:hypothetical protein Vretifemale_15760 [Volvox reticuliferus]
MAYDCDIDDPFDRLINGDDYASDNVSEEELLADEGEDSEIVEDEDAAGAADNEDVALNEEEVFWSALPSNIVESIPKPVRNSLFQSFTKNGEDISVAYEILKSTVAYQNVTLKDISDLFTASYTFLEPISVFAFISAVAGNLRPQSVQMAPVGGKSGGSSSGHGLCVRIFLFHKQQPWKPGGGDKIYAAMDICSNLGGAWLAHNVHVWQVIFCPGLGQGCNEGVTAAAGSAEDNGNVKKCFGSEPEGRQDHGNNRM